MTASDASTNADLDLEAQKSSRTGLPEPQITTEQFELIRDAEAEFEQMCKERFLAGKSKYGEFTFLEMPTIEMCKEEIADMANYLRFTFIKLAMLQDNISRIQQASIGAQVDGFYTMDQVLGITKEVG